MMLPAFQKKDNSEEEKKLDDQVPARDRTIEVELSAVKSKRQKSKKEPQWSDLWNEP